MSAEEVARAAVWLRKHLVTANGILVIRGRRKRVDYFVGEDFRLALTCPQFRKTNILPADIPVEKIAAQMLDTRKFVRGTIINDKTARREELDTFEMDPKQDFRKGDQAFFLWLLEPAKSEVYMRTALLIVGALALCMIKIWPMWLKIGIWWTALVLLITLLALILFRWMLAAIFECIGFGGIWLFPNMLISDDFMYCFTPLMGYGMDERLLYITEGDVSPSEFMPFEPTAAVRRRPSKKQSAEEIAKAEEVAEAQKQLQQERGSYSLSFLNLGLVAIIGILACNYMGVFMPDNIPNFVVKQTDLFFEYPSLAPPDYDAEAAAQAVAVEAERAELEKKSKGKKKKFHNGPSLDELLLDLGDDEEGGADAAADGDDGDEEEEEFLG